MMRVEGYMLYNKCINNSNEVYMANILPETNVRGYTLRAISGICMGVGVAIGVSVRVTVGCCMAKVEKTNTGDGVGSGMAISVNERI